MPEYLIKMGYRGSQKMIARWRCGNEEERNGYWKTEEEKRSVCGLEEGCIKHILTHTRNRIGINAVVDERGRGKAMRWMRGVTKLRKGGIESVRKCECG